MNDAKPKHDDFKQIAENLSKLAIRANGLLDNIRDSMKHNPHFGTLDSTLDALERTASELLKILEYTEDAK
jgi:hypothetical protein